MWVDSCVRCGVREIEIEIEIEIEPEIEIEIEPEIEIEIEPEIEPQNRPRDRPSPTIPGMYAAYRTSRSPLTPPNSARAAAAPSHRGPPPALRPVHLLKCR
ncbi:hypothetical protein FRC96_07335 [Lujinxingia vulgaris]|uniref:Uncharacterized protein n=1 Tax=Lujinxingia vulgaris TaxID=2600176 RepID=A0A5C6XKN0_9DELT|nr:hypothetical protein FRC96_07335 [Lujinxingia vulgaris]